MATNTNNDSYLQQIADTRAKLSQCFKEAHEQLTERETVLLKELDKIREDYETDSKKQEEELKGLQASKEFNTKNVTDTETMNAALKLLDLRIATILQTAGTRKISFLWDEELKGDIQHLGQIKVDDRPTPHPSREFTPGVKPLIPDYKSKCKPVIACCKKYFTAKVPGELISPRSLALDHLTERIYLADYDRVQVFSSNGDYCFMFSANMSHPWGICIFNDVVYVSQSSAHCINLYQLDGTYVNKIGSKGTAEGQFSNPWGIAVSEKTEYLYVCDTSNHRVQCFDKNNEFHSILGIGNLSYPRDVKITRSMVIILDDGNLCVHMFGLDHVPINSVIGRGDGNQVSNGSFFFDIDRETNIIITDTNNHNVKIFSKLGELLHEFGNKGEEAGGFNSPQGVLLDNKGRIVVVCCKQRGALQIF